MAGPTQLRVAIAEDVASCDRIATAALQFTVGDDGIITGNFVLAQYQLEPSNDVMRQSLTASLASEVSGKVDEVKETIISLIAAQIRGGSMLLLLRFQVMNWDLERVISERDSNSIRD